MNLKKLIEKRNALVDKLNEIVKKAEDETRAMNDDENKEFDQATAEIRALDATIEKSGLQCPSINLRNRKNRL